MAVTSKPTLKKTSINFSSFSGQTKLGNVSPIQSKVSSASHIKSLQSQRRVLDRVITLEEDVSNIQSQLKLQEDFQRDRNIQFQNSINSIQQSIGSLQSGQRAIFESQKEKAEIEARARELEKQRLKREGAEADLEGPEKDAKEGVEKTIGPADKNAKSSMGFLDGIKRFFMFVVAGWFTDKTIKLINAFSTGNKDDIRKIGIKLLLGATAIGGLMLLAAGAIGPVLAGIGSLIGVLAGLLFNPVTLTALLIAVGIGGAVMGIRALWKWGRKKALGGESFRDKHNELDQKLKDAGMDIDGTSKKQTPYQRKHGISARTEEQEKIFQEVQAERERIKGLKVDMDAEIKEARKKWKADAMATKVPGRGRVDWKPHDEKWKEIEAGIRKKYDMQVSSPNTTAVGDGNNVGSSASGDTTSSSVGPVESNEGNVTVVPNFQKTMDETNQKGTGNQVVSMESGNSDNLYAMDAKSNFNMY